MKEYEMKARNESNNEKTAEDKISQDEKENMEANQTKELSKTSSKTNRVNKTNDCSNDASAEGTSLNDEDTKRTIGFNSQNPPQKVYKLSAIKENNKNFSCRPSSESLSMFKSRQMFEPGLFNSKKPKLKIIQDKMVPKKNRIWINKKNCPFDNTVQNVFQPNRAKQQNFSNSQSLQQRTSGTNAQQAWKPLKMSSTKNKRPCESDNAILNYLKMSQRTDYFAHQHNKIAVNYGEDIQNNQVSRSEERFNRRTNAWALDPSVNDSTQFINSYPSIYVSQAGLINIFLRWGIILEVTADKVLRLVDRRQNMAIATSKKGKVCCIHHPSAKIFQNEKSADAELCGRWQVRRRLNHVLVADRTHSVWIDDAENFGTAEYKKHQFLDMSYDYTISLPCSSPTYGPWAIPHCMNLVASARFGRTRNSSLFVHLNDIHITQKQCGDVIVRTEAVVLRMRPKFGSLEVETNGADIVTALGKEIRCYLKESLTFSTSRQGLTLSNGKIEATLPNTGRVEFYKLPGRIPLSY